MDMMRSIAAVSMDMSAARFSVDYSLAVTKKTMETQELAGQELTKMLSSAGEAVGKFIDTYA